MTSTHEIAGAQIATIDTGSPRPGAPTLLLVHGFPLSNAMWSAQVEALANDFRVVAPDLRGYGASTLGGWPVEGEEASLDRYADDLFTLADLIDANGPVVLVGFSMGGYTALACERSRPERFDALALVDTRAAADTKAARSTRLKMAEKIHEWGAARVAELMRPNLFAPSTPDEVVDETVAVISTSNPSAIAASQLAMAARPDSTPMLPSIKKPTLVLCGEADALTPPEEMRSIAEAIPGASYVEVTGAGHMAPVEKPEAVNDALHDFASSL